MIKEKRLVIKTKTNTYNYDFRPGEESAANKWLDQQKEKTTATNEHIEIKGDLFETVFTDKEFPVLDKDQKPTGETVTLKIPEQKKVGRGIIGTRRKKIKMIPDDAVIETVDNPEYIAAIKKARKLIKIKKQNADLFDILADSIDPNVIALVAKLEEKRPR